MIGARARLLLSSVLVLVVACGRSSTTPTVPNTPSPAASGVRVAVLLDGDPANVQGFCGLGVTLSTRVSNESSLPLRVSGLKMDFATMTRACVNRSAPIDSTADIVVRPGSTETIRAFDAGGTVCAGSNAPGCDWTASAQVSTDRGPAVGTLRFSTSGRRDPEGVAPSVPLRDGTVVSGTLRLPVSVVEGCGCVNSARTYMWLFDDRGRVLLRKGPYDLGDIWSLDTTQFKNGSYVLRASQSCCAILGEAVRVTIQN